MNAEIEANKMIARLNATAKKNAKKPENKNVNSDKDKKIR